MKLNIKRVLGIILACAMAIPSVVFAGNKGVLAILHIANGEVDMMFIGVECVDKWKEWESNKV